MAVSDRVFATFTKPMDGSTITSATFTLTGPGVTPMAGTVSCHQATATFTPAMDFRPTARFTGTVKAGVKDLAGNALASDFVWHFTTGQAPVPLGSARRFAVLAGTTVTNTALLTTGDLGVSPGTAVTGFPPGVVNGTVHKGDPVAAQAKLDLTTAYNDAAGRSVSPVSVAGNLGGKTLYPALYKSTSSLAISSGDLTLDAQGDANAVCIFQMASTLTTTAGRQVILSGGAKASKIHWQVGSSANIGSTSSFKGSILAAISVTLKTGATLDGRVCPSRSGRWRRLS